jgi:hypothetical protein
LTRTLAVSAALEAVVVELLKYGIPPLVPVHAIVTAPIELELEIMPVPETLETAPLP